jgi:hypothetical protein
VTAADRGRRTHKIDEKWAICPLSSVVVRADIAG